MNNLEEILEKVKENEIEIDEAIEKLKYLPYKDIGHTKVDTHREMRRGYPEAIYCEGKTNEEIVEIISEYPDDQVVLATRTDENTFNYVKNRIDEAEYHEKARIIQVGDGKEKTGKPISVVSGGTSDEKIAEEAAVTAEVQGNEVKRFYDVGIAGVHRLLSKLEELRKSSIVIVVAGMEGALPGVVSGLIPVPVIGVPTSVGYGTNLNGIAPLLTMLNSCSPGLAVVNVDNGYGAAYMASLINEG